MSLRNIGIFAIIFFVSCTAAWGDPDFKVKSVKVDNIGSSPGNWAGSVKEESKISLDMPIYEDMSGWTVHTNIKQNDDELYDGVKDICDCFEDDTIGKDVKKYGQPQGEFPQECPIGKGDFQIVDFQYNKDNVRGMPEGDLYITCEFLNADGAIQKVIKVEAQIIN